MKRPSFQFYPADWRKDANLRRCSPASRGYWMDVLCILHDSDVYGVVQWPLKELASASSVPIANLRELVAKRVLKGCESGDCEALIYTPKSGRKLGDPVTLIHVQPGPIWFSARFVRDEHVRNTRGESSRFVADKCDTKPGDMDPPNHAPTQRVGEAEGDGSSSSSSSSPSGNTSDPNGSDGGTPPAPPAPKPPKSAEERAKSDVWRAAVSVLANGGCPVEAEARTFMGKLVGDYTFDVVQKAVAAAVTHQPAEAREYLKATCQRLKGERKDPVTVPSDEADKTKAYIAERESIVPDPERARAAVAAAKASLKAAA